jgi:hypothetical protein
MKNTGGFCGLKQDRLLPVRYFGQTEVMQPLQYATDIKSLKLIQIISS